MKEHPLPRSGAHDLDSRALRGRLEESERVIALNQQELQEATSLIRNLEKRLKLVRRRRDAFKARCQKLEAVAEAARVAKELVGGMIATARTTTAYDSLNDALAALDAKDGG